MNLPRANKDGVADELQAQIQFKMLEALESIELRHRALLQTLDAAVFTCDRSGRLTWANATWAALVNKPVSECKGLPLVDFLGDDTERLLELLLNWTPGRTTQLREFCFGDRWMRLVAVTSTSGSPGGVLVDVTAERDQMRLDVAVGTATDVLFSNSTVIEALPDVWKALESAAPVGAAQLQSSSRMNVSVGGRWLDPDTGLALVSRFRTGERGAASGALLVQHREPLAPMVSAAIQRIALAVGTAVMREDAIAELEFAKQEAERARSQAAEGERMKSRFLATVSHELRTPLASILGFSAILARDSVTAEQRSEFGDLVHAEGRRFSRMVDSLLQASHATEGTFASERTEVMIASLLERTARLHIPMMESASLEFNVAIEVDVGSFWSVDGDHIQQIVGNLLNNARKFTPAGGEVFFGATSDEGMLHITVADTGVGISADELPRVRERFFRAHQSSGPREGMGLGLAVCDRIVRQHDGTMIIESSLDHGTVVWVSIPAGQASEDSARALIAVGS